MELQSHRKRPQRFPNRPLFAHDQIIISQQQLRQRFEELLDDQDFTQVFMEFLVPEQPLAAGPAPVPSAREDVQPIPN